MSSDLHTRLTAIRLAAIFVDFASVEPAAPTRHEHHEVGCIVDGNYRPQLPRRSVSTMSSSTDQESTKGGANLVSQSQIEVADFTNMSDDEQQSTTGSPTAGSRKEGDEWSPTAGSQTAGNCKEGDKGSPTAGNQYGDLLPHYTQYEKEGLVQSKPTTSSNSNYDVDYTLNELTSFECESVLPPPPPLSPKRAIAQKRRQDNSIVDVDDLDIDDDNDKSNKLGIRSSKRLSSRRKGKHPMKDDGGDGDDSPQGDDSEDEDEDDGDDDSRGGGDSDRRHSENEESSEDEDGNYNYGEQESQKETWLGSGKKASRSSTSRKKAPSSQEASSSQEVSRNFSAMEAFRQIVNRDGELTFLTELKDGVALEKTAAMRELMVIAPKGNKPVGYGKFGTSEVNKLIVILKEYNKAGVVKPLSLINQLLRDEKAAAAEKGSRKRVSAGLRSSSSKKAKIPQEDDSSEDSRAAGKTVATAASSFIMGDHNWYVQNDGEGRQEVMEKVSAGLKYLDDGKSETIDVMDAVTRHWDLLFKAGQLRNTAAEYGIKYSVPKPGVLGIINARNWHTVSTAKKRVSFRKNQAVPLKSSASKENKSRPKFGFNMFPEGSARDAPRSLCNLRLPDFSKNIDTGMQTGNHICGIEQEWTSPKKNNQKHSSCQTYHDPKDKTTCSGSILSVDDVVYLNGADCHLMGGIVYCVGAYLVKGGVLTCRVGYVKALWREVEYITNRTCQVTAVIRSKANKKGDDWVYESSVDRNKWTWEVVNSLRGVAEFVYIDRCFTIARRY